MRARPNFAQRVYVQPTEMEVTNEIQTAMYAIRLVCGGGLTPVIHCRW